MSSDDSTIHGSWTTSRRADAPTLTQGDHLGRYLVLERLGQGAMGVVYAAYDPTLNRKVAVKLLRSRAGDDSDREAARLRREAQAMARLNHPNVVVVHEFGSHLGQMFVAMELVIGQTLAQWISEPRPWTEVRDAFVRAGRGLVAAHDAELVHRDFKPDNVLLGDDGRVVVMDFGLATPSSAHATLGATPGALDASCTVEGALVGTPAYMAPEQFAGNAAGAQTDQYAFCVSLWEALYGERPFPTATVAEAAFSASYRQRSAPARPSGDVPQWLHDVVARGLASDPGDRHPSMAALLQALGADPGRRRLWIATACAAVVAAGLATTWGYADQAQRRSACEQAGKAVARAWNDERRAEMEAAFARVDEPWAATSLRTTTTIMDDYAEAWSRERTQACVQTEFDDRWRPAEYRAIVDCLDHGLAYADSVGETLARADLDFARNAVYRATTVHDPRLCLDPAWLSARASSARTGAAPDSLRKRSAAVLGLLASRRWREAQREAEKVAREARKVGATRYVAKGNTDAGYAASELGDFEAAERFGWKAFTAATAGAFHEEAGRAAGVLAYAIGYGQHEIEDGMNWAAISEWNFKKRQRTHLDRRHMVEAVRAAILLENGEPALAVAELEAAHADSEMLLGVQHFSTIGLLQALAGAQLRNGQLDAASAASRRVIADLERALGPEHPKLIEPLATQASIAAARGEAEESQRFSERALQLLGNDPEAGDHATADLLVGASAAALDSGDPAEAERLARRATRIAERLPVGKQLPRALGNLGAAQLQLGHLEAGIESLVRARDLLIEERGARHPEVATTRVNLGNALRKAERRDEAGLEYNEVMRVTTGLAGAQRLRAVALAGLAALDLHADNPGAAVEKLDRALVLKLEVVPRGHPTLAHTLLARSEGLGALGRFGDARSDLSEAERTFERVGNERMLATVDLGWAKVEWAAGRSAAARQRAEAARTRAGALGEAGARVVAEADAWLGDRRRKAP